LVLVSGLGLKQPGLGLGLEYCGLSLSLGLRLGKLFLVSGLGLKQPGLGLGLGLEYCGPGLEILVLFTSLTAVTSVDRLS